MPVAHAVASGMNGLRAAGDLVARLEMTKGMRLADAKQYVAGRLGGGVSDLADPIAMHELRGELRLGRVFEAETTYPGDPSPLEAKRNIADLLDVRVNGIAQGRDRVAHWPPPETRHRDAPPTGRSVRPSK
jgi:dimethylamine--corrinoid protein Co-methyltransferase